MAMDFPGSVHVSVQVPSITMEIPTSQLVVMPQRGPRGPQGPPGDSTEVLGYTYTSSTPASVHQVQHNLPYNPGGIVCLDSDGSPILGWSVTYPVEGIAEITFGVDVTPTIFLS